MEGCGDVEDSDVRVPSIVTVLALAPLAAESPAEVSAGFTQHDAWLRVSFSK
jgi:hypothetical protein